ncbi:MAG TPA: nucleoside-diphosphate sugar epimerase [Methylophaga aminisulfidivorans]|uniref:Nucleoside-diphosphate sugar epimerase n=2 Tax=root TaxID=1 RepID=A0A7C2AH15_9GAMM|nr:nucleoside-diphosphate sugar epimerase [Methylophaga aminisulfidivorans]HEC74011.1 nucleoside-diphosphate sugar epimerase [Methylophaga aminisulfidivorans]
MITAAENSMVIWRLTDGKPGHESQSEGLVNALKRKMDCQSIDIRVSNRIQPLFDLLSSTWPAGKSLPRPDFIVGAGHRTHLNMLAAQRTYGGKTIVLMQPSLPVSFFDLCLIPEHDNYQGDGDVIETRGVLNPITVQGEHHRKKGLFLIGGPSKHYHWDEALVVSQILQVCKQNPAIQYTLSTSPRTPHDFAADIAGIKISNLTIIPYEETGKGWVKSELANAYTAWITEDSVSMVYEALTAQTAVGVLNMNVKKDNRVARGLSKLIGEGYAVRFDSLGHYKKQLHPVLGFMESDRCADGVIRRILETHSSRQPQALTV